MRSKLTINACLVLIAAIWGFGFLPQKWGMDYLGPAAFNALRFVFGVITLLPVIWFVMRNPVKSDALPATGRKTVLLGMVLGSLLFVGTLMQQFALLYTSVANVAFITSFYVIIVPMIGFFLGLRYGIIVWFGGVLAIVGLYLMTGAGQSTSLKGDLIALAGAVAWAAHLLVLSRKAGEHQQVVLSAYQFAYCALFSVVYALVFESILFPQQAIAYLWPIVNGVVVVGVGFTLQVLVMDKAEPFSAALILSLEAVFGALAGYWAFDESFTAAALVGAACMLAGCVLAQMPQRKAPSAL